jgi:NTP pyrophosphatase (non-canonical NTP hydrolase)
VDEELADSLIFLCSIANRYGINLSDVLHRKEQFNDNRTWPSTAPPNAAP